MPALPPVPGVVRVSLTHKVGTDLNTVARLFFAYTGPAPTNAQMVTFAGAVSTAWSANLASLALASVSLTRVDAIDLASATGAIGSDSTLHNGSRAGIPLTGATAVLLNYHIARRYRGGKPRTYLPFLAAADLTDQQDWVAANLATLLTGWNSFVTAIKAAPWAGATLTSQVNVSYYSGFASVQNPVTHRWKNLSTPRVAPLVDVITSTSANPKPGNQRHRNRPG